MQIVIDIPEEVLNRICFGVTYPTDMVVVCNAIHEHIKLPKGHGRLIDADALEYTLGASDRDIYVKCCLDEEAPTIIGADKEDEDVRSVCMDT